MFARPTATSIPPAMPRDSLRVDDFAALFRKIGNGVELLTPHAQTQSPLLAGHFSFNRLRDGLHLHCTDIVHLHDMHTRSVLEGESIKIMLKLEGTARVHFGSTPLPLDAGQGATARPCGVVTTLNETELFERIGQAGVHERMVVLTLARTWFDTAGLARDNFGEHLEIRQWQPSPRAVAITEQLIRPASFDGPMHQLYQESRALELIAEAFALTGCVDQKPAPGLPPAAYRRICQLQRLLDSGEADTLDMSAIAQHLGCNTNTLQQQFRQVFGNTIFEYLRRSRLERAAIALQRDGVSVARAAEIAGYSSQANFSTAFRRHFGQPPKHFRTRL